MPKISVIVPVYKVEEYLRRCVDSILNQTFQDFELILVDDGSPDNCPQICDEYAQKDNRVFVIHKENGGLSDARNKGIDWAFENSDSEWITFIDSDDWVHEQYLNWLYNTAIAYNVLVSVAKGLETTEEKIDGSYISIETAKVEEADFFWPRYGKFASVAWGKLYNKNLWKQLRFPFGKIHEDEYITYKILFKVNKIAYTETPLYYYFQRIGSIMDLNKENIQNTHRVDALKLQAKYFKKHKFKESYNKSCWRIVLHYKDRIERTEKGIDKAIEKEQRRELGRFLRRAQRVFPIRHYSDFYIMAYPKRVKTINFLKRIDSFLARIFKRENT